MSYANLTGRIGGFCIALGVVSFSFCLAPAYAAPTQAQEALVEQAVEDRLLELSDESFTKGLEYYYSRHYQEAIDCFNKAIAIKDDIPEYYESRALAQYAIGVRLHREGTDEALENEALAVYQQAAESYTQAIELNPENVLNYQGRGIVYTTMDKFDQALADFNKAIELQPDSYSLYERRAIAYIDMGEYDKAKADLDKASSLNPNDPHNQYLRGVWLARQGKNGEALVVFDELTKANKWMAEAWLQKAMVYEEVGQPLDAYFAYREFLGRDRENNPYTHKFAEERIKEITKIDYSKFGN